ncbi:MAG: hypothetical protein JXR41_06525 [Bacteroidales bacterium]|nr:hypothetical protein [Bacteroidales bacterium]MBN2762726.1 hypothetical protein [Bacteroidales bacterium]
MKRIFFIGFIAILCTMFCMNCKQAAKRESGLAGIDSVDLKETEPYISMYDTMGEGLPIFYNMYLSVEMSTLFDAAGAVFNETLLNRTDKITDYTTSSKKALNLGVYAVDLSYSKVFEQIETAGRFFNAMQKLAEELGIPADYFENTAKRFDRNINNKDSLIKIANEVYMSTDSYLKDNERYSAAAQIILGGWTEAIYIAIDIAKSTRDFDIIERLADQKYSLANLMDMLYNYDSDPVIAEYLVRLKALRNLFDTFEVKVAGDFDPASPEGKQTVNKLLLKVKEIEKPVLELRSSMVE